MVQRSFKQMSVSHLFIAALALLISSAVTDLAPNPAPEHPEVIQLWRLEGNSFNFVGTALAITKRHLISNKTLLYPNPNGQLIAVSGDTQINYTPEKLREAEKSGGAIGILTPIRHPDWDVALLPLEKAFDKLEPAHLTWDNRLSPMQAGQQVSCIDIVVASEYRIRQTYKRKLVADPTGDYFIWDNTVELKGGPVYAGDTGVLIGISQKDKNTVLRIDKLRPWLKSIAREDFAFLPEPALETDNDNADTEPVPSRRSAVSNNVPEVKAPPKTPQDLKFTHQGCSCQKVLGRNRII